MYGIN